MRFPVYLALAFYALPALAHPSFDVPVRALPLFYIWNIWS